MKIKEKLVSDVSMNFVVAGEGGKNISISNVTGCTQHNLKNKTTLYMKIQLFINLMAAAICYFLSTTDLTTNMLQHWLAQTKRLYSKDKLQNSA